MTKPTDEPWYVDEERKALITYHGFHGRQMPDPMGAKHREREAELKRAADEPAGIPCVRVEHQWLGNEDGTVVWCYDCGLRKPPEKSGESL